jgi:lysyl-tRNA synthetase class 2
LTGRKRALLTRASIFQAVRQFFIGEGYLEIDTPFRIPAPAPELHIDAVASDDWFLHTSPELCMKRMLSAGYDRIFQICRCWRDGERGAKHLPEFVMLEWYRSGINYLDLMAECENLIKFVAAAVNKAETLRFSGREIDLSGVWERLSVRDAFRNYAGMTMEDALSREIFDEVMVEQIEPQLGNGKPTFLYDYPAEFGALARLKKTDSSIAERFELYIGGLELANAFSELTDPVEQRRRFIGEAAARALLQRKTYPLPENFLAELAAMPSAAGIALGLDRLVMVFLNASCIDETVAFTPEEL